ncbi:FG-GAP-like repeat-containing protein [Pedococcus sp. NPDC057267]|uniref:FG-GAP-like repeat-containing protein n=1 Tax=Pedococcus sp. NPDC057267 TaxID=3346077 RepID=UPI00363A26B5
MRRVAWLVAAAVAAVGVVVSPAEAAGPPQLLSLSVSARDVAAPGQTTISYTASSDAPILSATAFYISPDGLVHRADLSPGATGSGTLQVPDGVENGTWNVARVILKTSSTTASQSVTCSSPAVASTSGCTALMDFRDQSLTVSGSTPDHAAPLVSSVAVTPGSVQPGDPVTVSWTDDEVHAVDSVVFVFQNLDPHAQSDGVVLRSVAGTDLSGRRLTLPLKPFAYNGVYQLVALDITDNLGNDASYLSDGTTRLTGGAVSPTSHPLDFPTISFTVTGSGQGLNPPQLTALHVTAPAAPTFGPIEVDFSTAANGSPLVGVTVTYVGQDGTATGGQAGGVASGTVAVGHGFGTSRLTEVRLQDARGDILLYCRDGTTYNPITGEVGSHAFNLPQYDVTVVPSAPRLLEVRPGPGTATVRWTVDPAEVAAGVTQTRLVVNPGGRTILVPNSGAQPEQRYTVSGLHNATTYSLSVAAMGPPGVPSREVHASVTPLMSDHVFSPGDVNRDGRDDLLAYEQSENTSLWLYRRQGVAYDSRAWYESAPSSLRADPAGDVNRDGIGDAFVVDGTGTLELREGDGHGSFWVERYGQGWDTMRFLAGGFDFTGDRVPDLFAVTPAGALYLYPVQLQPAGPRIPARTYVGSGWDTMQTVFAPGDFDGDHRADLMAVDSAGTLWLFRGNGHGSFAPKVRAGTGWGGFAAVFALRDFAGTGHADIAAIDSSGNLWRYAGTGTGHFTTGRTLVGTHWGVYL